MMPETSSTVPPVLAQGSLTTVETALPEASVIVRPGHGKTSVADFARNCDTAGIWVIEKRATITT